jgi:hypothetical protein
MLALVAGAGASAQQKSPKAACRPQGVWQLVEITVQGKAQPVTFQQRKLVTKGHWVWLAQALKRDTLPLTTPADSLGAFFLNGGAGTYGVVGNTYTETIDFFNDWRYEGKSLAAHCRMEGDRWYHSYDEADLAPAGAPHDTVVEVWRRVE